MGSKITGAKFGQPKAPRQPVIAPDSAQSRSFLKILYGLSEGEIAGLVDGYKSLYLEDTPAQTADGNATYPNLQIDSRLGTNDQAYIEGFPDVSNEISIGLVVKTTNPFVRSFTNPDLDAVRVRLSWAALRKTDTKTGDVTGATVEYAIDLQTDGRGYAEVIRASVSAKTSAGYERTHRIDLPEGNQWQVRVRRITPDSTSDTVSDTMYVSAITEVIDLKLRYPNTALIGLQYDAETFSSVAKMAAECRGKIIKVPSNYDAVARTYSGMWDGTFKQAYSNNPAWIYYDICTNDRYGLGNRLSQFMIDKWSLYRLAQYCDEQVDNGEGGKEPRFTLNVYLQSADDAYSILSKIAGVFRAISYWDGERIVCDADAPQDTQFSYSMANVIDGHFEYTGTRARDRHTVAKVAWDNPKNRYKTEYEFVRDEAAISKLGVRIVDIDAWGCTSRGQAQRAGLWALKSEQLETRQVSFKVGLDGYIPMPGKVIEISDALFAGRANGGRVSAVSGDGLTVTLDRDATVKTGDTLVINGDDGKSQRRTVSGVSGRTITVNNRFTDISPQNVWVLDAADLATLKFRVMSVTQDDRHQFTIKAIQYEPKKYNAIDTGAYVDTVPISIINPTVQAPVANVVVSSENRVLQGINVTRLVIGWTQAEGATKYLVEWRKDDGNWIRLPQTGQNTAEVDAVYSGQYQARVTAISAFDMSSQPTYSALTPITGKTGKPPKVASITATGLLFAMRIDWTFPVGAADTAYTEVQVSPDGVSNIAALGQCAYPTNTATINGLQGKLTQFYRARLIDRIGNVGDWSGWVSGTTTSDAKAVLDILSGQISQTQLAQDLNTKIDKIAVIEGSASAASSAATTAQQTADNASQAAATANAAITKEVQDRVAAVKVNTDTISAEQQARISAVKAVQDGITQEITDRKAGDTATLEVINTYKTSNDSAVAAVQSSVKTVTDAHSATAQRLDTYVSQTDGSLSTIKQDLKTTATKSDATASQLTQVQTDLAGKASSGALSALDTKVSGIDGRVTAQSSKLDGVYAKVTPITADTDQVTADSSSNQASAWTLQSAYTDGDISLSKKIDSVTAQWGNNLASINTQYTAQADKLTSLAQQLSIISAAQGGNISFIMDAYLTKVDANTVIADKLTTFKAEKIDPVLNTKADAGALTQTTTKVDAIDGRLQALSTKTDGIYARYMPVTADSDKITADNGSSNASSWSVQSALADKDAALSTRIDTVNAAVNDNKAAITSEQKARVDADSALASRIDTVQSTFSGNLATVQTNINTLSTAQNTQSGRIDTVQSQTAAAQSTADTAKANAATAQGTANDALNKANTANTNLATVQQKVTAVTDAQSATAGQVNTLQTTVNGNTASIQTQQQSINGLNAQYTVKLDVNGRVSGFGLANSGKISDFIVSADTFAIGSPGGNKYAFVYKSQPETLQNGTVIPAGLYLDSAFIGSIDAGKIKADSLSAISAELGDVKIKEANIENGAITNAKIGNLAVDTINIKDGAITTGTATNGRSIWFNASGNVCVIYTSVFVQAETPMDVSDGQPDIVKDQGIIVKTYLDGIEVQSFSYRAQSSGLRKIIEGDSVEVTVPTYAVNVATTIPVYITNGIGSKLFSVKIFYYVANSKYSSGGTKDITQDNMISISVLNFKK